MISDKINQLNIDLLNAYSELSLKGATIPANKNSNNLQSTIATINSQNSEGLYAWKKYQRKSGITIPTGTSILLHFNHNLVEEYGHKVTTYGNVKFNNGKFDSGIDLSGNGGISIPYDENAFGFTSEDWTFAGWFHRNTNDSGWRCLFDWSGNRASDSYIWMGTSFNIDNANNRMECNFRVQNTYFYYGYINNLSDYFPMGQWTHFAVTKYGSNCRVFINGVQRLSSNLGGSTTLYQAQSPLYIGCRHSTTSGDLTKTQQFFNGRIDDFIVVKGTALWTSNFTPPNKQYGNVNAFQGYVIGNEEESYSSNEEYTYQKYGNESNGVIELDSIKSSGTQYIDSGYVPNTNTRIEMKFKKIDSIVDYERIFGVYQYIELMRDNSNNNFILKLNDTNVAQISISADVDHELIVTNNYIYLDGNVTKFSAQGFTANGNLEIFHCRDRFGIFQLYYLKIYENNVLVRDFIPALDNNNIVCLYDTIENIFYYNIGSGDFSFQNGATLNNILQVNNRIANMTVARSSDMVEMSNESISSDSMQLSGAMPIVSDR